MIGRRIKGARRVALFALATLAGAACGGGLSRSDCEPLAERAGDVLGIESDAARARLIDRCKDKLDKDDLACAMRSERCLVEVVARLDRGFSLNPLAPELYQQRRQAELLRQRAQAEAARAKLEARRRAEQEARRRAELEAREARRAGLQAELRAKQAEIDAAEARGDPRRDALVKEYEILLGRLRGLDVSRPRPDPAPVVDLECPPGDPLCQ